MPTLLAAPLFLVSLAVTLAAARVFARRLDRLGVRFGFPEALIGLLTAAAADGPNVASALFALAKGAHNVGVGVLVGSNAFQLAAMIGLSALLAGSVRIPGATLALEGLVGVLVTLLAAALLFRWLTPVESVGITALVTAPYLALVIVGSRHEHPAPDRGADTSSNPTHHLLGLIVVDVALIIAGSAGMVQAALSLGAHWHVASTVLGVLILAPLTSLPNAATAIRLGLADRGTALVGETFNSNSINLGVGVIVPSLFVSFAALTTVAKQQLGWLVVMTVVTLAMLARPRGLGRAGAVALIILYFAFAAGTLVG